MRRSIFIAASCLLFLSSCDPAPLGIVFDKLPSEHQLSESERAAVEGGLRKYAPTLTMSSLKLKSSGSSSGTTNVCGLVNGQQFFAGYLYSDADGSRFNVKIVEDAVSVGPGKKVDVRKLCGS